MKIHCHTEYYRNNNKIPIFCIIFLNKLTNLFQIFEYNDVKDDAKINKITDRNIVELDPRFFKWKHGNLSEDNNVVRLKIEADSYFNVNNNDSRNGSLKILVSKEFSRL